jgi:glycosyltransferase involved in cell wall biosynthesis
MMSRVAHSVDVTISVWNRFHSEPLANGLVQAGYRIRVLGSVRRAPPCHDYRMNWTAGLLTQMAFRTPYFRDCMIEIAHRRFERFAAEHVSGSRVVWGWCGWSLDAFSAARRQGARIVLETGSTHVNWCLRRLREDGERFGLQHGLFFQETRVAKILEEYALADQICVPSRFVADTFLQEGIPENKVFVNPYGVDSSFWGAAVPSGDDKREDRPFTVVFAGQIMLRKGIHHLIEAWRKASLSKARLLIAGGMFADARPSMRDLPVGVEVIGFQTVGALRTLYAGCDLYVLPSLEEGMARSVLEAMAAGLPVIITRETGCADLAGEGQKGWVVPSGNPDALAAALVQAHALRDRLCSMGLKAQQDILPRTWGAYGNRCASFLLDLIGPP